MTVTNLSPTYERNAAQTNGGAEFWRDPTAALIGTELKGDSNDVVGMTFDISSVPTQDEVTGINFNYNIEFNILPTEYDIRGPGAGNVISATTYPITQTGAANLIGDAIKGESNTFSHALYVTITDDDATGPHVATFNATGVNDFQCALFQGETEFSISPFDIAQGVGSGQMQWTGQLSETESIRPVLEITHTPLATGNPIVVNFQKAFIKGPLKISNLTWDASSSGQTLVLHDSEDKPVWSAVSDADEQLFEVRFSKQFWVSGIKTQTLSGGTLFIYLE